MGRRVPAAAWAVAIAAVVIAAVFISPRKSEPTSPSNAGAGTRPPTSEKSPATAPQLSEARKLGEKAKSLQDDFATDDTLRDNLTLAEELCKRAALRLIEQPLVAAPNDINLLGQKAWLLASLGDKPEAERVFKLFEQLSASNSYLLPIYQERDAADFFVALGRNDEALAKLEAVARRKEKPIRWNSDSVATNLRLDPSWDPLRGDPRFDAVIKELSAKK